MPRINGVDAGSIAEEGGVAPGEELISINGELIADVFDYRFLASACELELLLKDPDGNEWILEVEKTEDEDLGLEFDGDLFDEPRPCGNRCIFCFIDQLPRGMRKQLYFKDDDVRLTFINGNYVTLTNVSDDDLSRIIRYRLSPVNISVHTTDVFLRARMLGYTALRGCSSLANSIAPTPDSTPAPTPVSTLCTISASETNEPQLTTSATLPHVPTRYDILPKIKLLTDSGIHVNAQIVLCHNYNDGAALDATLSDLSALNENLQSISVVPSGLTKHRDGLPPLEAYDGAAAIKVLKQVSSWQKKFMRSHDRPTVYAADEFYSLCGRRTPGHASYRDYAQLENGVGMATLFWKQFCLAKRRHLNTPAPGLPPTYILTGYAALELINRCVNALSGILPNINITVIPVKNHFFGETVTVSGLLTGCDIIKCAQNINFPKNARIFIPKNMLKYGSDMFLDDYTLEMLRNIVKVDIIAVENDGGAFFNALTSPTP